MKKITILFVLSVFFIKAYSQCSITLQINNVEKEKGDVLIAIYNNEDDYMKSHYKVSAINSYSNSVELEIDSLFEGYYALTIFQDLNGDKKLNIGMFGPKEPYGFSNDAKVVFGPPSFDKSKFFVDCKKKSTHVVNLK